jgi:hypothetical protein
MADARSIIVVDASGAPLTSGTPSVQAFDRTTGASRTAPTIAHVAAVPGTWRFTVTDADETTGTVVLVDFGATNLPRFASWECFKGDNSNQFWSFPVVGADGSAWSGAAPTFGGYTGGVTPTLTAMAGAATALYVAAPSAGDVTAAAEGRVDGPAGSSQPYWNVSTKPLVESSVTPTLPASTGSTPEQITVDALLDYLRRYLPAKVAQLNPLRVAVLKSALVAPFIIPSGAVLRLSATSQESAPTDVTLTSGTRTAAQVVADITAASVPGITATADAVGRVVLTATATPAPGAPSVVVVARDNGNTGSNAAFGWAEGGEHIEVPALVSPSWRGVVDGRPLVAPDMGQGFWVMLGNRNSVPDKEGIRRDLFKVTVSVEVWRPFSANAPPHRTREAITACARAVRELILTTDGRYLGRQGAGDVQLADVGRVEVAGDPLRLNEVPGVLFDTARMTLTCRVFQRPE